MASQHQELLKACADGDIVKVRDAISSLRQSGKTDVPIEEMALEAAENGHAAVIEICINEGLDTNDDWEVAGDMLINAVWEKKFGRPGLQGLGDWRAAGASGNEHLGMVQWLLDHGADLDEIGVRDYGDRRKEKDEGTALHKAMANGDVEMARLPVGYGADLEIKDPMGRTPLTRALEEKQHDAAAYLRSINGLASIGYTY
ncbi:MAG: hypothetical protein Q9184_001771 [Pyrenodesmia sp. 2 TL-2023]